MVNIKCPGNNGACTYTTGEFQNEETALEMLWIHKPVHDTAPEAPATDNSRKQKPPAIERPKISDGSSEETRNAFTTR
jgi:hypothetical protein